MEKFWKYKLDHVLFWVITVGFHIYTRTSLIDQAGWNQFFLEIIFRNGLLAVVIYTHLQFLVPTLALRRQAFLYMVGLVLCLALYVAAKSIHDIYLDTVLSIASKSFWTYAFYNGSIALFYLSFSFALQLSKEWFFQRVKIRQMEIEKLNAELEYLKLQMNPHFLFNSLNTIYFQIDKTNGLARETLLKFSDLLRYPLYECNEKEVLLEKEITYLKNYVDLQRLRKDENYPVKFEAHVSRGELRLAPLLLIPFVENAFKHISHFPDKQNEIQVRLIEHENSLSLNVLNTRDDKEKASTREGIGLRNVRRRLDLVYGSQYSLDILESEDRFEVNLTIPLHET